MGNPNASDGQHDVEGLMEKIARQAQFHAFATAPKPAPKNASDCDELARFIVTSAHEIMGNPADAIEIVEITFPNLSLTPSEVPEGAVAPDPRFLFLLSLRRALNSLPN